ncbi:MAG: hypothetical protein HDR27_00435 [Lachnospiraceae bacterium]|nr:hypothetical protein [Lachnospiraceae bacterium]
MSIETYTNFIIRLFGVLFLLFTLMGAVGIWKRMRGKTLKYWWVIPCSILFSFSTLFSTFIASIAYNDPADPNYAKYEGWELHNFILHNMKTFLIWLLIGILLYFVFEGKATKASIKTMCATVLNFLAILLVAMIVLSLIFFLI